MWKLRATLFSIPAIAILTIALALVSIACSLWDRTGNTQHRIARFWSRILLRLGWVRCAVTGVEKLDPAQSYVLVSNHASYIDTPVIVSSLPLQFRFLAKKGLFSIPFLGWHLSRAGHIPVIRDDPRASLKTLADGARLIRETGTSLLLFPEGGRSPERLQPFKDGAAYFAIKAGVPVVPIGLVHAREVLPMDTLVIRPGTVELHVGDPISTEGMTIRDRTALSELLLARVAELTGEPVPETAQA